jgi:hypothetical protein
MKQERLPTQSVSAERRTAHLTLLVKATRTVQMVKSALTGDVCLHVEVSPVVQTGIAMTIAFALRVVVGTRRMFTTVMATLMIQMQMEHASRVSLK